MKWNPVFSSVTDLSSHFFPTLVSAQRRKTGFPGAYRAVMLMTSTCHQEQGKTTQLGKWSIPGVSRRLIPDTELHYTARQVSTALPHCVTSHQCIGLAHKFVLNKLLDQPNIWTLVLVTNDKGRIWLVSRRDSSLWMSCKRKRVILWALRNHHVVQRMPHQLASGTL